MDGAKSESFYYSLLLRISLSLVVECKWSFGVSGDGEEKLHSPSNHRCSWSLLCRFLLVWIHVRKGISSQRAWKSNRRPPSYQHQHRQLSSTFMIILTVRNSSSRFIQCSCCFPLSVFGERYKK